MLYPAQELSIEQKQFIIQVTKRALLNRAMKDFKSSKETDWIFRELVIGDPTGTFGSTWTDLNWKTTSNTNQTYWGQKTTDMTIENLKDMITANQEVDPKAYIGFYGLADLSPEGGLLTGAAAAADYPPRGSLLGVEFKKGGNYLDFWGTEQLYSYPAVVGFSDRPCIYGAEEKSSILMNFSDATEDKFVCLRAMLAEPNTTHITLDKNALDVIAKDGVYGKYAAGANGLTFTPGYIPGGIFPIQEMTIADVQRIKDLCKWKLTEIMIENNVVDSIDKIVFREPIYGTSATSADWYDIDSGTSQTANHEHWCQDQADLSADYLMYKVTDSAFKIKDQTAMAIYGWFDRTPNPDAIMTAFEPGQGFKDFWHVEHLYGYGSGEPIVGITDRPIFYGPKDSMGWYLAVKNNAADKNCGLRVILAEKYGETLSSG